MLTFGRFAQTFYLDLLKMDLYLQIVQLRIYKIQPTVLFCLLNGFYT